MFHANSPPLAGVGIGSGRSGITTTYIQNGGLECSSVEIWFKAQGDSLRALICEVNIL